MGLRIFFFVLLITWITEDNNWVECQAFKNCCAFSW